MGIRGVWTAMRGISIHEKEAEGKSIVFLVSFRNCLLDCSALRIGTLSKASQAFDIILWLSGKCA